MEDKREIGVNLSISTTKIIEEIQELQKAVQKLEEYDIDVSVLDFNVVLEKLMSKVEIKVNENND